MHFLVDIHIAAVCYSFGVILLADREAFAWFRGRKQVLDRARLELYHGLMWIGLTAIIVTGILMFLSRTFLLHDPLFLLKMAFVAALLINGAIIGRLIPIAANRSYASLSRREFAPLAISGAVSTISWLGAVLIAVSIF